MAYNQDGGMPERQMFEGNWKCSKCGAEITKLPFQPAEDRLKDLLCRDCHRARRDSLRR